MFGAAALFASRGFATPLRDDNTDRFALQLLSAFPETAVYCGAPGTQDGGRLARRIDDWSVSSSDALTTLLKEATISFGAAGGAASPVAAAALALARNGLSTRAIRYGRRNPLWFSGHVPYVIAPVAGPHINTPAFMIAQQSLATEAAVDAWLEKLEDFEPGFDRVCDRLRHDEAAGCRPPAILLQKSLQPIDAFLEGAADAHPLIVALRNRTADAGIEHTARQHAERRAIDALEKRARPAYARLRTTVAEMARRGSVRDGVWAQPDGDALYAANVRALGDTALSPADIHVLGLAEVTRISAAMEALLSAAGMSRGSIGARMAALGQERRFSFGDGDAAREAIIATARGLIETAEAQYPRLLPPAIAPTARIDVRRVAPSAEAGTSLAFADPPSLAGDQPGILWLNLSEPSAFTRLNLPTTVFHESVPGHFMAAAVAVASGELPLLLKITNFNAFNEGWALYAEALIAEMGAYRDDPWGNLGRLNDELWRAVRLVVDTGLHHRRWSRKRAMQYMARVTGKPAVVVMSEIERYMAWPGQALGYKLGELRIQQLRKLARSRLGASFNLMTFHRQMLENGSLPLDVVEAQLNVHGWV